MPSESESLIFVFCSSVAVYTGQPFFQVASWTSVWVSMRPFVERSLAAVLLP